MYRKLSFPPRDHLLEDVFRVLGESSIFRYHQEPDPTPGVFSNYATRALKAVDGELKYLSEVSRVLIISHSPLIQQMVHGLFPEKGNVKHVLLRGCQGFRFHYLPGGVAKSLDFLTF